MPENSLPPIQSPMFAPNGNLTAVWQRWWSQIGSTVEAVNTGGVMLGGDIGGTTTTPKVIGIQAVPVANIAPVDKQVLTFVSAKGDWEPGNAAQGTVTSVGLAMPAEFTVTGSPVTGSGTLTAAKSSQAAHTVYAGPSSGSAAPAFRTLAQADMPSGIAPQVNSDWNASSGVAQILNKPTLTNGTVTSVGLAAPAEFTVSGSPVTTNGTLTLTKANQNANQVYAGPSSGAAATPGFRTLVAADIPFGAWINWTPTFSAASVVAVYTAMYLRMGAAVHLQVCLDVNLAAGASTLFMALPLPGPSTGQQNLFCAFAGTGTGASNRTAGYAQIDGGNPGYVALARGDGGAIAAGNFGLRLWGTYATP